MRRLSQLLSLVLLTLWFPATECCSLEAAGLIPVQGLDACMPGQRCSKDDCAVVDAEGYKSGTQFVKVLAPVLPAGTCFLCLKIAPLAVADVSPAFSGGSYERPLDWVTTWHFVRRAAPAARAPSPSIA